MEKKEFDYRRRKAFDRLETLVTSTTMVSVMGTLICGLYAFTEMDALVLLLVSAIVGSAAGLLANSAMSDFYRRYVSGTEKGNSRPVRRQDR